MVGTKRASRYDLGKVYGTEAVGGGCCVVLAARYAEGRRRHDHRVWEARNKDLRRQAAWSVIRYQKDRYDSFAWNLNPAVIALRYIQ